MIYGKNVKINRQSGTTFYQLGGTILDAKYDPRPTVNQEVGSDTGRTLAADKVVSVKPQLEFTMNVRRLVDYLTTYCMITANGAVPAHDMIVTDGSETFKLFSCKADKIRITINQTDPIKAVVTVLALSYGTAATGTFLFRTEAPMYKDAVGTLTLDGTVVNWKEIEISCDNNVLQEILGSTITPAAVEEQHALFEITITRAKPATSLIGAAYNGTAQTLVIELDDHQTSPVEKILTFTDCFISTSQLEDHELGIVYEKITVKAKTYTLTDAPP